MDLGETVAELERLQGMTMSRSICLLVTLLGLVLLPACQGSGGPSTQSTNVETSTSSAADTHAVRMVVRRLGDRLQRVSLLAPRATLVASLRAEYAELVAPALLEEWIRDPKTAPGRLTSSPWPDHIEVDHIAHEPNGEFDVRGRVIEMTRATPAGRASARIPVQLTVARIDDRWLIVQYQEHRSLEPTAGSDSQSREEGPAGAVGVVEAYYQAINERRFRDAYRLWGSNGAASGKSFEAFRAGFSETAAVEAMLGSPGRVEGAAGSRYVEVPIRVVARLRDGTRQDFTGKYILRRSVVDGATAEQRAWHIHSAEVRQVQ